MLASLAPLVRKVLLHNELMGEPRERDFFLAVTLAVAHHSSAVPTGLPASKTVTAGLDDCLGTLG